MDGLAGTRRRLAEAFQGCRAAFEGHAADCARCGGIDPENIAQVASACPVGRDVLEALQYAGRALVALAAAIITAHAERLDRESPGSGQAFLEDAESMGRVVAGEPMGRVIRLHPEDGE